MFEDKAKWAYETMACHVVEEYRMPGVADAFAEGSYCLSRYYDAMDAYRRLLDRLGTVDEDPDVELIFAAFLDIQMELCLRMYRYGQKNAAEGI